MPALFLANPLALWALLGLPVVLAIHLLRRRSRQVRASTLFLLQRVPPSHEGGRRLRWLRQSPALWWQLLAILALTLLWAQPRWLSDTSAQTVVTILDSSASLSAFRDRAADTLAARLADQSRAAAHTQWIILDSTTRRLASGTDLPATLATALRAWTPVRHSHDLAESLRLARTLAGPAGPLIVLTDHAPATPDLLDPRTTWIAIGEPIPNLGFVGTLATETTWQAYLKNFSPVAQTARWHIDDGPAQQITLQPGQITVLSGRWPASGRLTLRLDPDRFTLDDTLPLIRPEPKLLLTTTHPADAAPALVDQILRLTAPSRPIPGAGADLLLGLYDPANPLQSTTPAILFPPPAANSTQTAPLPPAEDNATPTTASNTASNTASDATSEPAKTTPRPDALLIAERTPLMEDLNWQGLALRPGTATLPAAPGDIPLLWQGDRPLILLRHAATAPQLIFTFDPAASNLARLPAFPLLLHRFITQVRDRKPVYQTAQLQTAQPLTVAGAAPPERLAPDTPGYYEVTSPDGTPLLDAAVSFTDLRESDFATAATLTQGTPTLTTQLQKNAQGSHLDPLWALILAGCMVGSWLPWKRLLNKTNKLTRRTNV